MPRSGHAKWLVGGRPGRVIWGNCARTDIVADLDSIKFGGTNDLVAWTQGSVERDGEISTSFSFLIKFFLHSFVVPQFVPFYGGSAACREVEKTTRRRDGMLLSLVVDRGVEFWRGRTGAGVGIRFSGPVMLYRTISG